MSFVQDIYEIENKARRFICDRLDKETEIILLNPIDENNIYDSDELAELPQQIYVGKYEQCYFSHIVKLYKEDDQYYAKGFEQENGEFYDFNLFESIDSFVLAELADFINE